MAEHEQVHEHVRVAVIGSGFGGLGAAVRLRREGITDFVVLERAGSVGGTWRDNSYPGCACDVPSHLYSFSFAPNPEWPRTFSGQEHIRAYLEHVADTFGLRPHLRFDSEVKRMAWDTEQLRWEIETVRGTLTADVVVSATGPLSDPKVPDIPGLDTFPGKVFHSARWDHDYDLAGQRVAMIGTGASAIQIVPSIQPKVDRLTLFQRTPAWVMPRVDRAISGAERALHRALPATTKLRRGLLWGIRELQVQAFTKHPNELGFVEQIAKRNMGAAIKDPALRAKLTPDYRIGCKRILLSSTYYPALAKPNVDVVASGLSEVRGSTLVAADGTEAEADAIVFGTGFHVTDMPIAERVVGADGRTLAETWKGGMEALRGGTAAGFPNFMTVIGPNTGLGNSSMILMIESQLNYLADYLRQLNVLGGRTALDPRPTAVRNWNHRVQERMKRTVWNTGGCTSWYLDASGRNTTVWPGTTAEFRRETRRVDLAEYQVLRPAPAQVGAKAAEADTGADTGADAEVSA
ncbi:flavin-containing monooxygenase [Streptomyces lividans]|uniref:Baeyer-Villiger monooxygenase n=2 Tax=Streptomyces lividans TaxID=1916 RepID=A0A7U9DQF5_STRLI|nr:MULTISPECIES: NAD(P)/FAD-dependent oxidoreductase [Streptomyces]QSJ10869.1 monooxygenase [Streptomyces lividans]AIJ15302.1 monooxygenase [Streptomyces lividans TK24]EFD68727.1 monooxygenase [Streptomyces lividans TK24]EOY48239.1 Cyclohexanone monooxygenase [Streptomyces lividans 1326]KKD12235.1 cyclohexanone monooxygenase [Streptomyces sp. WM6391]